MRFDSQIQATIRALCMALAMTAAAVMGAGCETSNHTSDIRYSSPYDDDFQRGVNRPPSATTLFSMARVLANQQRDAEAELILQQCITQFPRHVPCYNELAELYLRRQKVGEAIKTLHAGREIAPNSDMLLNNLGMCWMVREEYEQALAYFTQAASEAPDDARYRANMATCLGMLGRYDESLALYKQITSRAKAHYNLSVLCSARDDEERAALEYEAAILLDPTLSRY